MHVTLKVTGTGRLGDGIADYNGRALYLPSTLTGDVATVDMSADGRVLSVQNTVRGAAHGQPVCDHFTQCGGCKLQHMQPEFYQQWKQDAVLAQLRANGLEPQTILPASISPPRSRRRATFAARKQGKKIVLGFHQAGSTEIIDIMACAILRPEIMAVLPPLRLLLARIMTATQPLDIRLTLVDGVVDMVLIGGTIPDSKHRTTLADFAAAENLGRVSWRKWERGANELIVQHLPLRAVFSHGHVAMPAGAFMQATAEGEATLTTAVAAAIGKAAPVADLFCGIGTFALSLSPRPLVAVDMDGEAIEALQQALRHQNQATITKRDLIVEPLTAPELNKFKAVIFDPPRGGAKAQAQHLAVSKVPTIAAISCDLDSFCRDAKILLAGGYTLTQIMLVDQFLWSPHVELFGLFQRQKIK